MNDYEIHSNTECMRLSLFFSYITLGEKFGHHQLDSRKYQPLTDTKISIFFEISERNSFQISIKISCSTPGFFRGASGL